MRVIDRVRYAALNLGMRTLGRASDGICLGLATGFDSGTMVDYIYRNRAQGVTPLGVWLDRIFLDHPVWKGVRARRALLVEHLRMALQQYARAVLFDVAAGPGSYLFLLPPGGDYWAGDASPTEVARGAAHATEEGRSDIHFAQTNAFDPSTWPVSSVDVLVASGFFDILVADEEVDRLLWAGTEASHAGARWVWTVMERHTDTELLRRTMPDLHGRPWVVRLRTAEEILARAKPCGWVAERVERETAGFFAVATMRRDG